MHKMNNPFELALKRHFKNVSSDSDDDLDFIKCYGKFEPPPVKITKDNLVIISQNEPHSEVPEISVNQNSQQYSYSFEVSSGASSKKKKKKKRKSLQIKQPQHSSTTKSGSETKVPKFTENQKPSKISLECFIFNDQELNILKKKSKKKKSDNNCKEIKKLLSENKGQVKEAVNVKVEEKVETVSTNKSESSMQVCNAKKKSKENNNLKSPKKNTRNTQILPSVDIANNQENYINSEQENITLCTTNGEVQIKIQKIEKQVLYDWYISSQEKLPQPINNEVNTALKLDFNEEETTNNVKNNSKDLKDCESLKILEIKYKYTKEELLEIKSCMEKSNIGFKSYKKILKDNAKSLKIFDLEANFCTRKQKMDLSKNLKIDSSVNLLYYNHISDADNKYFLMAAAWNTSNFDTEVLSMKTKNENNTSKTLETMVLCEKVCDNPVSFKEFEKVKTIKAVKEESQHVGSVLSKPVDIKGAMSDVQNNFKWYIDVLEHTLNNNEACAASNIYSSREESTIVAKDIKKNGLIEKRVFENMKTCCNDEDLKLLDITSKYTKEELQIGDTCVTSQEIIKNEAEIFEIFDQEINLTAKNKIVALSENDDLMCNSNVRFFDNQESYAKLLLFSQQTKHVIMIYVIYKLVLSFGQWMFDNSLSICILILLAFILK